MSDQIKKNQRDREIIDRLNEEIDRMRRKTTRYEDDNPLSVLEPDVVDLAEVIHSGVLPRFKKPTIH